MRPFLFGTIAALFTLVTSSACGNKKKPPTDSLPIDQLSADDVLREQTRILAGDVVGQLLMAPKIEIDYRGVTVNGRLVVTPSDLDTTTLARIPKLYAWLKGTREHWRTIHPGEDFHGLIELDAAPEADALAGESVIETAASAGYPRVRLKIEEIAWDATLTIPLRPSHDDVGESKPDVRLRLRRGLVGWEIDALVRGPCDERPSVKTRVVRGEALAGIVDEMCPRAERCLLSVEASPGALLTVAKLVAPAFGPGRPTNVSLDLFAGEGVSAAPDGGAVGGSFENDWSYAPFPLGDPSAMGDPSGTIASGKPRNDAGPPRKKPLQARIGVVQVNGRLAPDAVERVVGGRLDVVRACYEDELRGAPSLAGRVAVRFAIDASGAVAHTCNGGSDLPSDKVIACIVKAWSTLTFPAPESGIVDAVVPIVLAPL